MVSNGMIRYLISVTLLLAGATIDSRPAEATEPLPWNWTADRQSCPISSGAVWAEYAGGKDCIRYFASGDIEGAAVVIILFRGDRGRAARQSPEEIRQNTAREQEAIAERMARRLDLPIMVVARPGTYGSSGSHFERRQASEFLALNAALDEIRARHGIQRLVVLGHSGGATAAAALLTFGRTDISCAVLTSGAFSLLERAQLLADREGRDLRPGYDLTGLPSPYDPLEHVDGVAHDPARRIILIGNANDRITPFVFQREFAEALKREGHNIEVINYPARPPQFHNLKDSIGLKTAARCARGEG